MIFVSEATVAAAVKAAPKRNCHAQHIIRLCAAASMFCSLDSLYFYRMSEFQVMFAFVCFLTCAFFVLSFVRL